MNKTEEAIILVGGLGTRLRGIVNDVPKPLAPVAGRPFLAWLLDAMAVQGMRRIILATGHMSEKVETCIGQRWNDMEVVYSVEHERLGTGGAIAMARDKLLGDAAHVLNGDSYVDYEPLLLQRHAQEHSASIGVALASVVDVGRYGAASIRDGRIVGFSEKGGTGAGWINAGCYHLNASTLSGLSRGAFSFETEVVTPAVIDGKVAGCKFEGRFIDIGVPEDYLRAQTMFGTT